MNEQDERRERERKREKEREKEREAWNMVKKAREKVPKFSKSREENRSKPT